MTSSQQYPEFANHAATNASIPFWKKVTSRLQFSRRRDNYAPKRVFAPLARTSQERLDASLTESSFDATTLTPSDVSAAREKGKTVLYLAYGSNLCNETFRGVRGIKPISQVNVLVPSLRLTFDLPGIPYIEPCFGNSALRTPDVPYSDDGDNGNAKGQDYHKDRWHKGLVGVVYEVTLSDYAHIIATEGGGSSYKDVMVDCYVLPDSDTVPTSPSTLPFKAHTLFAPRLDQNNMRATDHPTRPDPSYAQPSARYLKLITDGATECNLPAEYQDYLHDIRPYTITSKRQAAGKALFAAIWMPFIVFVFSLNKMFQDKKGRSPAWLSKLVSLIFAGVWLSYDGVFKEVFGDGERTVGDEAMGRRFRQEYGVGGEAEKEALLEEVVELMHQQA
ncbi:hypothetical protein P153DRAFT_363297 [Dothidotthia symphoricarpi CBS 119687]|uniref:gamma-glutamylcyclotransferase n=1 Tax=Dothidotthia symphoricarpi CBS 119687 TaxID=1392245 RepID=A0A6A6ATP7_9PLEO|nr:uncharacterized protein P153DRAFT_363297 [Dothidotthia symphoricarpi CBS 119687]KAF2134325.1 hypothetical protein P153DRAFT_363297 [Dothidotthia symphoricarpi CBS 119687]